MLFEPVKVGPLSLRNHFQRSATYEGLIAPDATPTKQLKTLLTDLAVGHVGLIVPGFLSVSLDGRATVPQGCAETEQQCASWTPIFDSIHEKGSKVVIQLVHGGVLVKSQKPVVPSALDTPNHELTGQEIEDIIDQFIRSAKYMQKSGADGVQLHCAHGFLLSGFMSPLLNQRKDKWGDQTRVVSEIARGIRAQCGQGFFVGAKINGNEYFPHGTTPGVAGKHVKSLVNDIDLFEISSNRPSVVQYNAAKMAKVPIEEQILARRAAEEFPFVEAYHLGAMREIHRICPEAKLALVGGMRSLSVMEKAIKEGATLISLSRPLIREPHLVQNFENGQKQAKCISCGLCFDPEGSGIRCAIK